MATVQNALGLLNLFSLSRPEIGLTEFKNLCGFDKGTTHRYLTSLRKLGFLEQNSETKAYRLGPALVRLAAVREHTFPITKIVAMHVDELATQISELVHASLLTEDGMSSFHHCDGGISGTRVGFDASEILPLHATSSGIAMLAFGSVSLIDKLSGKKLPTFTDKTDTDPVSVRKTVLTTRDLGYSFLNQTYEDEVCSIALPFYCHSKIAAGVIAVATPRYRMTEDAQNHFLKHAMATARTVSSELGGQIPPDVDGKWRQAEMKGRAA